MYFIMWMWPGRHKYVQIKTETGLFIDDYLWWTKLKTSKLSLSRCLLKLSHLYHLKTGINPENIYIFILCCLLFNGVCSGNINLTHITWMYPLPSPTTQDCLSFAYYQTHWVHDPISRPLHLLFLCLRLPFAQITIQTPQFTALGSFRDLLSFNLLMATSSTSLTIGITLPNLFFKIAYIKPGKAAMVVHICSTSYEEAGRRDLLRGPETED